MLGSGFELNFLSLKIARWNLAKKNGCRPHSISYREFDFDFLSNDFDLHFFRFFLDASEIQCDPNRSMHFAQTVLALKTLMGDENLPETLKLVEIFGRVSCAKACQSFGFVGFDNEFCCGIYLNSFRFLSTASEFTTQIPILWVRSERACI